MNRKITFAILGFAGGIAFTWAATVISVDQQYTSVMRLMGMRFASDDASTLYDEYDSERMHSVMNDMMMGVYNKGGDSFDQAFLEEMIIHHQGAVRMAEAALRSAKHQEIIDLAKRIIALQVEEINQMQSWQEAWYPAR